MSTLREQGQYTYRLDTNFAKMDRIVHAEIESFKRDMLAMRVNGLAVGDWSRLLASGDEDAIRAAFEQHIEIKEEDPAETTQ